MPNLCNIRNFCIIAHIDHGKSTLADRILDITKMVSPREAKDQYLDRMDIERERGITIKSQTVRIPYKAHNGQEYEFNLLDTPGHVDFNYEVSRSLAACEGALLVVDATQGVEAQTLGNVYLALDQNVEIIPVLNKIDLPSAHPEEVKKEIEDIIGIDCTDALECSAKTGQGVPEILEAIVDRLPAPKGDPKAPLQALIFDSWYDSYQGVVVLFRIMSGTIRLNDHIRFMSTGKEFEVLRLGVFSPEAKDIPELHAGEVGFLCGSIKELGDARVGDTITNPERPAASAVPGFKKVQPMVFCGFYPTESDKYENLKIALEKLQLNDAALSFEAETSAALGFGYRCGFLGLLHMEIIEERLEREFNLDLVTTAPSVIYRITKKNGDVVYIDNPSAYPAPDDIQEACEPMVKANIITPTEFVGGIMDLCQDRRGIFKDMKYIDSARVELHYHLPLNEIVYDFFDALKSRSKGYASLDYEFEDYVPSRLVKMDILLNGEVVDALSFIVHSDKAYGRARKITEKLKENIPRQLFEIPVQAAVGGKVIARETVKAMRKDVLAKCYGGDITRKKKLLEKQKEGKKKMRQLGSVQITPEAFMAVLKLDDE